jgi:hypothetical protein
MTFGFTELPGGLGTATPSAKPSRADGTSPHVFSPRHRNKALVLAGTYMSAARKAGEKSEFLEKLKRIRARAREVEDHTGYSVKDKLLYNGTRSSSQMNEIFAFKSFRASTILKEQDTQDDARLCNSCNGCLHGPP